MSSFFGERTAEYALVPVLQHALKNRFGSALPIFYWKTREGNRTSSEIHRDCSVKVLAMFARRPKVWRENYIWGMINYELFQFADAARSAGIPTIAAFPAVGTLHDLYNDPSILWFPVDQPNGDDFMFFVDTSQTSPVPTNKDGHPIHTLSLEKLIDEVAEKAKVLKWDEAMEHLAKLRTEPYHQTFFGFGWMRGYKPVYFLMVHNDNGNALDATICTCKQEVVVP